MSVQDFAHLFPLANMVDLYSNDILPHQEDLLIVLGVPLFNCCSLEGVAQLREQTPLGSRCRTALRADLPIKNFHITIGEPDPGQFIQRLLWRGYFIHHGE